MEKFDPCRIQAARTQSADSPERAGRSVSQPFASRTRGAARTSAFTSSLDGQHEEHGGMRRNGHQHPMRSPSVRRDPLSRSRSHLVDGICLSKTSPMHLEPVGAAATSQVPPWRQGARSVTSRASGFLSTRCKASHESRPGTPRCRFRSRPPRGQLLVGCLERLVGWGCDGSAAACATDSPGGKGLRCH
jgi:hypothetical protein